MKTDKPTAPVQPRLTVKLRSFPESNGKRNWTALLVREDETWDGLIGNCGGITVDRGEFWNRVAYKAERARFLIGERDTEPHILDYGDDIQTPDEWAGEVRGEAYAQARLKSGSLRVGDVDEFISTTTAGRSRILRQERRKDRANT